MSYQSKTITFLLLIAIYCLGWIIQASLLLNWDVSWLAWCAKLLLQGGTYSKDYFETNPPLIFYLSVPPVLFTKYFHLDLAVSFRVYIFLLSTVSIFISVHFITKIFNQDNLKHLFYLMLALIFLVLPLHEFAQREHLLLIFMFPYIFLVALRLQNQTEVSKKLSFVTGVLAGIGFCIKPHFLLAPLFVELYYCFKTRNWFGMRRPETISMFFVGVFYFLTALILNPDYFSVMLPYINRLYYSGVTLPFSTLFYRDHTAFCGMAVVLYLICYQKNPYRELSTILVLGMSAFFCAYLLGGLRVYYHFMPPLLLAILIIVFHLSLCLRMRLDLKDYLLLSCVAFIFFIFLKLQFNFPAHLLLFNTSLFFIYFFFIIAAVLSLNKPIIHAVLSASVIIFLSFIFFKMVVADNFHEYFFVTTLSMMLLTFILFIRGNPKQIFHSVFLATLTALVFAQIYYCYLATYQRAYAHKLHMTQFIDQVKNIAARKNIYFLTTNAIYIFPVADLSHATSVSRFPFFWMMPGILKKPGSEQDKKFFIDMVVEDIQTKKPDFIFVDVNHYKNFMPTLKIEFLDFFLKDPRFVAEWQNYQFLKDISLHPVTNDGPYDRLRVYRRISDKKI